MAAGTTIPSPFRRRRIRPWKLSTVLHPAQLTIGSFAAVILLGTVLLSLPVATATGRRLPLIDAFFTATSATCVTGLTAVDTATHFSVFGQIVILFCIQIGGLGLMTLTTVFLVAAGRRLAIADRIAIQESFHHSPSGKLGTLILYIVLATLLTEAAGALLLTTRWLLNGTFADPLQALYFGVFHAISAFCNAGFALRSDSMVQFSDDFFALTVLSALIIAGGLGFLVGLDLKEYFQQRFLSNWWSHRVRTRVEAIRPRPRLSLHTKFVVTATSALLVVGFVSYYLLERNGVLREMGTAEALWNAWFCSVTARTAGFNTVDYAQMSGPALLCTMVLMFIGASPGSAGGGVKTSTFGLLLVYAAYRWRGRPTPHAFKRSIPQETVDRASSVVVTAVGVVVLAASVLMGLEARTSDPLESQARFLPVLFETFSAFGTVGLSMNFTPTLTPPAKVIVALVMFIGRVGPLTLALGLAARKRHADYEYAEENVMVG